MLELFSFSKGINNSLVFQTVEFFFSLVESRVQILLCNSSVLVGLVCNFLLQFLQNVNVSGLNANSGGLVISKQLISFLALASLVKPVKKTGKFDVRNRSIITYFVTFNGQINSTSKIKVIAIHNKAHEIFLQAIFLLNHQEERSHAINIKLVEQLRNLWHWSYDTEKGRIVQLNEEMQNVWIFGKVIILSFKHVQNRCWNFYLPLMLKQIIENIRSVINSWIHQTSCSIMHTISKRSSTMILSR